MDRIGGLPERSGSTSEVINAASFSMAPTALPPRYRFARRSGGDPLTKKLTGKLRIRPGRTGLLEEGEDAPLPPALHGSGASLQAVPGRSQGSGAREGFRYCGIPPQVRALR